MHQQAIHAVFRSRELRVVEIIGVNRNSVHECRESRRSLERRSDDDGLSPADAKVLEILAADGSCLCPRSGQREAQSVKNRFLAEFNDVRGNIFIGRVYDKSADIVCQSGSLGEFGSRRNVRAFCGSKKRTGRDRPQSHFPEVTP